MDGWKEGWMDGGESWVKDCLQQSISRKKLAGWMDGNWMDGWVGGWMGKQV